MSKRLVIQFLDSLAHCKDDVSKRVDDDPIREKGTFSLCVPPMQRMTDAYLGKAIYYILVLGQQIRQRDTQLVNHWCID